MDDRRRAARRPLALTARMAGPQERPVGSCELVDASSSGLLAAFSTPSHPDVAVDDAVLLSVRLPGELRVHVIATVRRCARGDDGRAYLGLELRSAHPDDVDLLLHARGGLAHRPGDGQANGADDDADPAAR